MTTSARVYFGGMDFDCPAHPVWNPARRQEQVGEAAKSSAAVVDSAVRAAASAARVWASTTAEERIGALAHATAASADDLDGRARVLTREQGKVLWESHVDLAAAPYLLYESSRFIERVLAVDVTEDSRGRFVRRHRPAGVVAVIVPWNYPVVLAFNAIAPALAAGNTVVVKPPELAPLALTATIRAVAKQLPPGVLNVIPGYGDVAGKALSSHPLVRRVMFTGGVSTGREVMRAAATNITTVGLELGGNDAALVLESATVTDELACALRDAAFVCSGQVCLAVKRVYVHATLYQSLIDALIGALDRLIVGDGLDPASSIGPLISEAALHRVNRLIDDSRKIGARVQVLGSKLDERSWEHGNFVLPHLVSDIPHRSALVRAEQFGPVLPIVPFDTEEEAVQMANDSEYGLAASVWSDDTDHAFHVAGQIESGTVFVNVHRVGASDHSTPFGGMKQSGIGRINGWASIEEVTETQMLIRRDDQHTLPGPPTR